MDVHVNSAKPRASQNDERLHDMQVICIASFILVLSLVALGAAAQPNFVPLDRETPVGSFIACKDLAAAKAQRELTYSFVLGSRFPKSVEEMLAANCFYLVLAVRPLREVQELEYARGWNSVYDPQGPDSCDLSHINMRTVRCRSVAQEVRYFHANVRFSNGNIGTAIVEMFPTQIEQQYLKAHPPTK